MRYPGCVIEEGEADTGMVRALGTQFNKSLDLVGNREFVLDKAELHNARAS